VTDGVDLEPLGGKIDSEQIVLISRISIMIRMFEDKEMSNLKHVNVVLV
jgi:hypothetical protein